MGVEKKENWRRVIDEKQDLPTIVADLNSIGLDCASFNLEGAVNGTSFLPPLESRIRCAGVLANFVNFGLGRMKESNRSEPE